MELTKTNGSPCLFASWLIRGLGLAFFALAVGNIQAQRFDQITKVAAADRAIFDFTSRQADDGFGRAVAISGNYAVVGVPGEDDDEKENNPINDAGGVYIYKKDPVTGSWFQMQKLVGIERAADDRFGFSVAISGNVVVVGAYFQDDSFSNLTDQGAAYVFRRDQFDFWSEEQKLIPSNSEDNAWCGFSVAVDGDYVLVGAHREDRDDNNGNPLTDAGAAYLFKYDGSGSWDEIQKITASDRAAGDWFGFSVAISGERLIVGARNEDEDPLGANSLTDAGSAYIFQLTGGSWTETQKITAADRTAGYHFGYSVAIDSNYAVVGAFDDLLSASDPGAAYVFFDPGTGYAQQQKLTASDGVATDWFGISVGISGNKIAVAAQHHDLNATGATPLSNAGSAYIFARTGNTWAQQQKIVAADRAANDQFGCAIAINGNTVLIGANEEDEDINGANTRTDAGSVYFNGFNGNWNQQQKQVPSFGNGFNQLGYYADISGDYAILGAVTDGRDANGLGLLTAAGAAYIYKKNPQTRIWEFQQKLVAADRAAEAWFGYTVAIDNDYAVVTALFEEKDSVGNNIIDSAGAAYVFRRTGNTWTQTQKIVAHDRLSPDTWYGSSVALENGTLVIGASQESRDVNSVNPLSQAGAVYIYQLNTATGLFVRQQKVVATDRAGVDRFGFSVSISGDYIISGAYRHARDAAGANPMPTAGAAYILHRSGGVWAQQAKLVASDRDTNNLFGFNVHINGDRAVVSSLSSTDAANANPVNEAGAAYTFRRNGTNWPFEQKLVAPAGDRHPFDYFGYCLQISGNRLVAGAPSETADATGGNNFETAGASYVYEFDAGTNSWQLQQKLLAGDRKGGAQMGYSVAIEGNDILIGAVSEQSNADNGQSIYAAGAGYFYHSSPNPYYSNGNGAANSFTSWNSQRNNWGNAPYNFAIASGWVVETGDTLELPTAQSLTLAADSIVTEAQAKLRVNGALNLGATPFRARGTLAGNGTVSLNTTYTNQGIVSPGNSAGQLNIAGNFSNGTGALNIELGGLAPATQHDVLAIIGNSTATISGTLNVSLINGFAPAVGQTFTVVTAATVSGTFATVNWPPGYVGSVIYNPTSVVLTFLEVIPLKLLSFTGAWQNDQTALLQWQTAQEENMEGFELQWSSDGVNFATVYVQAARNTLGPNTYSYQHPTAAALNFYRLVSKDRSGQRTNSPIVRLAKGRATVLLLYPNPTKEWVQVALPGNEPAWLRLTNAKGQTVLQQPLRHRTTMVSIGHLPPGYYWAWVEQNGASYHQQLLKQ
jgi:hypothetical protein